MFTQAEQLSLNKRQSLRSNALMQQDRADIERLRGEARELRAEPRARFAGMGVL